MISGFHQFEHTELCMGTAFKFQGRSSLPHGPHISAACDVLHDADRMFSTYKPESPISRLARGETRVADEDPLISEIWDACLEWERITDGWFSAFTPQNTFDPSGLVKTWAAQRAADVLLAAGILDFTMNAGGDILIAAAASGELDWRIGVHQPVSIAEAPDAILTVVDLKGTEFRGFATSGSAERGLHIWNPKASGKAAADELLQVSVVARDIVTADVWATAAFAEGPACLRRLEKIDGVEAIIVLPGGEIDGTSGFAKILAV
ncbi:MAG: FAD:protein FMN transferase [Micrococcales bacterium]